MDHKVSCEGGFIRIRADRFGGIAVCVLERLDQKGNCQCARWYQHMVGERFGVLITLQMQFFCKSTPVIFTCHVTAPDVVQKPSSNHNSCPINNYTHYLYLRGSCLTLFRFPTRTSSFCISLFSLPLCLQFVPSLSLRSTEQCCKLMVLCLSILKQWLGRNQRTRQCFSKEVGIMERVCVDKIAVNWFVHNELFCCFGIYAFLKTRPYSRCTALCKATVMLDIELKRDGLKVISTGAVHIQI
jgi:hypothetical protein